MRAALIIFTTLFLSVLAGCKGTAEEAEEAELLTVDFQQTETLRYKFVSSRDIDVDWDPTGIASKSSKGKVDKFSESMDMVVAYTPIEVDPYGLTTVKATCKSVKVERSSPTGRQVARKDAVENLAGKTFTLAVGPAGSIEDYSQLNKLIREIGEKAFRSDSQRGRIKEPDMISDVIATQWFLWDSVSSIEIEKAIKGISVGQTWKSILSVPNPMVIQRARNVIYTLSEIRQTEKGRIAVITSSYSPAKSVPRNWPIPYSGRFQMSGIFGFLRGYKVLDLQGQGEELFNIDAGRIQQYNQQYQVQLQASFPMALGVNPRITIKQNLTMQLLED